MSKRIHKMENKLKAYRAWKGIKQNQLSKETNICSTTIRRIENNNYFPKYQVRQKLCDYFGINQKQLFILDQKEE